jgi:hypothetical protein
MRKGKDSDPEADLDPDPDPYLWIREAQKLAVLQIRIWLWIRIPNTVYKKSFLNLLHYQLSVFFFILAVLSIPRAPASEGARGDRK